MAILEPTAPLSAQEARLTATPPLGDALPLVKTAEGVHLKFPVLLNAHTVVGPEATLRLVYVDPNAGLRLHSDEDHAGFSTGGSSLHHRPGDMTSSQKINPATADAFPSTDAGPSQKAMAGVASSESWGDVPTFRDALDSAADVGTTLIYALPGKAKPASAEVDLPGGMLLGRPDDSVVVLALASDSEAGQAGLEPQDEIRSINGQAVPGTLEGFARFYRDITEQARKAGAPYTFQVLRPSQSKTVEITVGAPPSMPKMF